MAKPIRATPELKGEDARRFIERMLKVEKSKPTKKDFELAQAIATFSQKLKKV